MDETEKLRSRITVLEEKLDELEQVINVLIENQYEYSTGLINLAESVDELVLINDSRFKFGFGGYTYPGGNDD